MTLTLELKLTLEPEEQARLKRLAQLEGLELEDYLKSVIARLASPLDAHTLRKLPREERNHLLAAQAEAAAPLYEADLARPVEEREQTAMTALDGDEVYEHTP